MALFPSGTKSSDGLPSHHAGFFIEAERHDSDDWWLDAKFVRTRSLEDRPGVFRTASMVEFRIPKPAEVTFHRSTGIARRSVSRAPRFRTLRRCRPFRRGIRTLTSCAPDRHSVPVRRRPVAEGGSDERHAPRVSAGHDRRCRRRGGGAGAHPAIALHSLPKLDRRRRARGLAHPRVPDFSRLTVLPFRHPYFDFLSARPEVPSMTCIQTCC
jgi:hypothetical protein